MYVLVNKTDQKANKLSGARFEIRYYNDQLEMDQTESRKPSKRWILETDKNGTAHLGENWKVSGDEFYYNEQGRAVGLIGTYVVEEVEAPEGYELPKNVKDRKQITRITASRGANTLKFNNGKPFEITNSSQKGKIGINKIDKETRQELSGIKFDLILRKNYDKASDIREGSLVDTLTVGEKDAISKDLPLGQYEIRENRTSLDGKGYVILKQRMEK